MHDLPQHGGVIEYSISSSSNTTQNPQDARGGIISFPLPWSPILHPLSTVGDLCAYAVWEKMEWETGEGSEVGRGRTAHPSEAAGKNATSKHMTRMGLKSERELSYQKKNIHSLQAVGASSKEINNVARQRNREEHLIVR